MHDHLLMSAKSKFYSIETLKSQAFIDLFFINNIDQHWYF